MSRCALALVVAAVSVGTAGCGASSGNEGSGTRASTQAKADAVAARATQRFAAKMRRQYGPKALNAPWYGLITKVELTGGDYVQVFTSVFPDSEGKTIGDDICGSTLAALDRPSSSVTVFASDSSTLADCERA